MKRILFSLMASIALNACAQTYNGQSVILKNNITLKGVKITDFQNDTAFTSDFKLPTALAVKKYVAVHGGGVPTLQYGFIGIGNVSNQLSGSGDLSLNEGVFKAGINAGLGNTAATFVGIGAYAGGGNTGNNFNGIGGAVGNNNTGNGFTGIGAGTGQGNSGNNFVGVGRSPGVNNTGNNFIGIGEIAGHLNTGNDFIGIGYRAGFFNIRSNVALFGSNSTASDNKQFVFNNGVANARHDYGLITANQLYTWRNQSGTVAFLSDIPDGGGNGTLTTVTMGADNETANSFYSTTEVGIKAGSTVIASLINDHDFGYLNLSSKGNNGNFKLYDNSFGAYKNVISPYYLPTGEYELGYNSAIINIKGDYTATNYESAINYTEQGSRVFLPSAIGNTNKEFIFINSTDGDVYIITTSDEEKIGNFFSSPIYTLASDKAVRLKSNGKGYKIIHN